MPQAPSLNSSDRSALICGVNGQDGAYLAQLLLGKGYRVWGTSRDALGSSFGNLKRLGIREGVETLSMQPKDLPIGLPVDPAPGTRHAYHLYTIQVDEARTGIIRDAFLDAMTAQHKHPFYQQTLGWRPEDYPHALWIGRQTVSLPISAKLTDDDVGSVIEAVFLVLGKAGG
jgi:hypothetical protein